MMHATPAISVARPSRVHTSTNPTPRWRRGSRLYGRGWLARPVEPPAELVQLSERLVRAERIECAQHR